MKVLVTGAGGFVGAPVTRLLAGRPNAQILALGRRPIPDVPQNVSWVNFDVFGGRELPAAVEAFAPDAVIHLAWEGIPDFSAKRSVHNLIGTLGLFDRVLALPSVRRVVVSGTCFEYDRPSGACAEDRPARAKDYFTWAKHSIREYLSLACAEHEVDLAWMRLFYVYGPGQRPGSLIPTVLSQLATGRLPDLKTPKNANDFVYVEDVARGILAALDPSVPSGVYNLGSAAPTQVLEVCSIAEQVVIGSQELTRRLAESTAATEAAVGFWSDPKRSRDLLRWTPSVPLTEGVLRTWEALQAHHPRP